MKPTISCGRQLAEHADISGSVFIDVNLSGAEFENVNLGGARLHDINLSGVSISAANLGGAHFRHIGPAPDKDGSQERQKSVTFEEAMLCDSVFRKVDMSGVRIFDCDMSGMTIDGVQATDLITAYCEREKRT